MVDRLPARQHEWVVRRLHEGWSREHAEAARRGLLALEAKVANQRCEWTRQTQLRTLSATWEAACLQESTNTGQRPGR